MDNQDTSVPTTTSPSVSVPVPSQQPSAVTSQTAIAQPSMPSSNTMPQATATTSIKKPFVLFDPGFLLRVGLAFVFVYAAVNFFFNPVQAFKYVPEFVSNMIPVEIFLHAFEVYEVLLAVWLLSGKFSQYAGIISALTLVGITGLNLESFNVVFRNVAIIFASIALTTLPRTGHNK